MDVPSVVLGCLIAVLGILFLLPVTRRRLGPRRDPQLTKALGIVFVIAGVAVAIRALVA